MAALTAVVLSIEMILALSVVISHFPPAVNPDFFSSVIWHLRRGFQPQTSMNLLFYAVWVLLAVAVYACLRFIAEWTKPKKGDREPFLLFHLVVVALMAHAGFAVAAMADPVWAWPVFWGAFGVGLITSIFWPEFVSVLLFLKNHEPVLAGKSWIGSMAAPVLIFLILFIPDLQAFVAMAYMGDYFHDWDGNLFGGVYALTKGLLPYVDVHIPYGLGMAVIIAKLLGWLGGFDYARILGIAMWAGIVYFILWFFLLKQFLSSGLLALAAVLCGLRLHMFNLANGPCMWVGMTHSFFRYCFDAGVFWMLWKHIQTRRMVFLWAGAFFVALGLFYMLQTGLYMVLPFCLYVVACTVVPAWGGRKDWVLWRNHALIVASIFAWGFLWLYLSVGSWAWRPEFFKNLFALGGFYFKGVVISPVLSSISSDNILSGIGGLLYPVFCMGTFLYVMEKIISGAAENRDVFAGLLGFYGVVCHTYYIQMVTDWYVFGLPGVFLLFYWIAGGLERLSMGWRRLAAWGLAAVSLYCLVTVRTFTGYPNLLSPSRNPIVDPRTYVHVGPKQVPYFHQLMVDYPEAARLPANSLGAKDEQLKLESDFADDAALKTYYASDTAWSEDVALIDRLTPQDARVPVLSSFETLLLAKADRKPFFYYFPVLNSRPLTVRNFMVTVGMFTYGQLQKLVGQMEAAKPPYIFMERIFLTPRVPAAYFYEYDDLIFLLRYVLAHYKPVQTGQYLVAMKRVQ